MPPFPTVAKSADGSEVVTPNTSWRQPFELGGTLEVITGEVAVAGELDQQQTVAA